MTNPVSIVKLGKTYRLKVGDGTTDTEAFNKIAGEQTLSKKGSSETIDTASKDDGNVKSQQYGQRTVTISAAGEVKLPDAGLARLAAVAEMTPPNCNIEIVDTSTGADVVVFAANVSVGNDSIQLDNGKAATYSFDLTLTGPATTNTLFSGS
jgi:predicted secreted protein